MVNATLQEVRARSRFLFSTLFGENSGFVRPFSGKMLDEKGRTDAAKTLHSQFNFRKTLRLLEEADDCAEANGVLRDMIKKSETLKEKRDDLDGNGLFLSLMNGLVDFRIVSRLCNACADLLPFEEGLTTEKGQDGVYAISTKRGGEKVGHYFIHETVSPLENDDDSLTYKLKRSFPLAHDFQIIDSRTVPSLKESWAICHYLELDIGLRVEEGRANTQVRKVPHPGKDEGIGFHVRRMFEDRGLAMEKFLEEEILPVQKKMDCSVEGVGPSSYSFRIFSSPGEAISTSVEARYFDMVGMGALMKFGYRGGPLPFSFELCGKSLKFNSPFVKGVQDLEGRYSLPS